MNKEKLRKLRTLNATREMMEKAYADVPTKKPYGYMNTVDAYKYGIYIRCQLLDGILKVAFFLTEYMRIGSNKPVYELFINNATGEFVTWDVRYQKWSKAKLDMLNWPSYCYRSGKYINQQGNKSIKSYLKMKNGGYKGILDYQLQIREDELKKRYKRETNPWDQDMEQIPELPKDWERWVDKVGMNQNYIFYEYSRKGAETGYCTWCEKDVTISNPKHNIENKCSCCGRKITYKSIGKAGSFYTNDEKIYLIQRCDDGIVIREFNARRYYRKLDYKNPDRGIHEIRRSIYNEHFSSRHYYFGEYKNHEFRWIKAYSSNAYYMHPGAIYGKTIPSLAKKELSKTGLPEMVKALKRIDPEIYLQHLKSNPIIEQLVKAGLTRLAMDLISNHRYMKNDKGSLSKVLGIDNFRMKRLRKNNGGLCFINWLKHEKEFNKNIPDEVICWFDKHKVSPKDIEFISDRMSEVKMFNYMKRQLPDYVHENAMKMISDWKDYLSMAKRVQMDVYDEIVYKAKELKKRHDNLVEYINNNQDEVFEKEMLAGYPEVNSICMDLKQKYEFSNGVYAIIGPESIRDIINEGKSLHHCVGSSERYFERINTREAYILFLRKAEELDKPYYTLEIEPNGTIRQKRTEYDRQNKDIENASKFLSTWQRVIQERLTVHDKLLAENSKVLRIQGIEELRKNNITIHIGDLAGELLADVLEADLMEVV